MFLSIAESLETDKASAEACRVVSREMRDFLLKAFSNGAQGEISSDFIRLAETYRAEATEGLGEGA